MILIQLDVGVILVRNTLFGRGGVPSRRVVFRPSGL